VEFGRRGEDIKFFQGLSFVIGDTEEEALAKAEEYEKYISIEGYLAHSALVDSDGRVYDPQTPLRDVDTNTAKGFGEWVSKAITDREPIVADIAVLISRSTRLVGTPEQIADALEIWQAAGVDGINVINWVIPGSFEEFADKVLPVLRARGLAQSEYGDGPTLRDRLFGEARLNDRHPAAKYRGAFAPVEVGA
ncbi:MAG: LLM class flavin-dependent oxidoreductase, partial [Leifsonia flava]